MPAEMQSGFGASGEDRGARVTMSHGGGGALSREIVRDLLLPAYGSGFALPLSDSAVIALGRGKAAFTTDCFVVKPLFFRGGDIGRLSVSGTVNDLAVAGARPIALSVGMVIEEGLEIAVLGRIAESIGRTASEVPVAVVAGDTKVVERGAADGIFITTSGIGAIVPGGAFGASRIRPGDAVIVTGTLGDHGIAVMSERAGLRFETPAVSDAAPLWGLVEKLISAGGVHAMRDPTRGGAAAALNELAQDAGVGIEIDEESVPIRPEVGAACDMLGLDPLSVANEGKVLAFVSGRSAHRALEAAKEHALGRNAAIIGSAVSGHPGVVAVRTRVGGRKVLEMPYGEGLPRIC